MLVFWYFYVNKWLITKQFAKETLFDYFNWRKYDVKTSISSKNNSVTKFNDRKKGFYLKK